MASVVQRPSARFRSAVRCSRWRRRAGDGGQDLVGGVEFAADDLGRGVVLGDTVAGGLGGFVVAEDAALEDLAGAGVGVPADQEDGQVGSVELPSSCGCRPGRSAGRSARDRFLTGHPVVDDQTEERDGDAVLAQLRVAVRLGAVGEGDQGGGARFPAWRPVGELPYPRVAAVRVDGDAGALAVLLVLLCQFLARPGAKAVEPVTVEGAPRRSRSGAGCRRGPR